MDTFSFDSEPHSNYHTSDDDYLPAFADVISFHCLRAMHLKNPLHLSQLLWLQVISFVMDVQESEMTIFKQHLGK